MRKKNKDLLMSILSIFSVNAKADTAGVPATTTTNLSDVIHTVYSKEVEFKALPNMRFLQFAQEKTELGTEPGLTISMLTYDNLEMGGSIAEGTPISTQALSGSTKSITVTEYGNAVSVSEKLIRSSFDDVMSSATTLLGRDYAMVMDCELRDVELSNTSRIYARKSNGEKVTSRAGLDSTSTMKVSTVKDAIEVLATANAPKYANTNRICFVHPHQSRDLRDDNAWINASNYGAPEQLFNGEIGRIDDTRFIETTLMCNGACASTDPAFKAELKHGADGAPASTDVYQSVVFGDAYYGIAWSLPVEIRDNGVEDFGRKRSLAWYAIWGTGLLHSEYGIVIETA